MQELDKRVTEKLMKLIQKRYVSNPEQDAALTEEELDVIQYGGIDNRLVLIFDDCASLIDQSMQKNTVF